MAAYQGLLLVLLLLFEDTWSRSRGQQVCPAAAVTRAQAVVGRWCLTAGRLQGVC
jgi:hypothetical protein